MFNTPIDPEWSWSKIAVIAALSCFGGVMGYIMRSIDSGESIHPARVLLEGLASIFFGIVIGMLCMEYKFSLYWTLAIVSVTAWLGARTTIKALEPLIMSRFGVQPPPEERRDDHDNGR